eukprot:11455953-Alexandrium_andersonii.AAC.1
MSPQSPSSPASTRAWRASIYALAEPSRFMAACGVAGAAAGSPVCRGGRGSAAAEANGSLAPPSPLAR